MKTKVLIVGGLESRALNPIAALASGLVLAAQEADRDGDRFEGRHVNSQELAELCECVQSLLAFESAKSDDAVDPVAASSHEPTPREKES